jgi:tetratricopeptide (TPR) repeat protein
MAVKLLEPVATKFPNDYGIHANLGTAYHLLGQYPKAEKEIARDLEINPQAHFALEKYHLALLQYLVRDTDYKSKHVYVDEYSRAFENAGASVFFRPDEKLDVLNTNALEIGQISELAKELTGYSYEEKTNSWEWKEIQELKSEGYTPPPYRFKWDLATDANFEAGVIYMAQMNPKEPACFEMLGVAAMKRRDYNLAVAAYEKAIALGSLKTEILQDKIAGLRKYIHESLKLKYEFMAPFVFFLIVFFYYAYSKIRDRRRKLIKTT